MAFPVIGVIAPEIAVSHLLQAGSRLGIEVLASSEKLSADDLIKFGEKCQLICVEPSMISLGAIKVAEQSGIQIYPSSKVLEAISTIELSTQSAEQFVIVAARSAHAQHAIWPISLLSKDLLISPAPGVGEEQAVTIAVSALNLLAELALIGGIEIVVDANDYQKLQAINWLQPRSAFATEINCVTNYYEQYLRAVLDLPLGDTNATDTYVITGSIKTDPNSDDYRPYLHLMARNPKLKFDQRLKLVGLAGNDLETILTEIIHAQQYYSGEIQD
jgi:phosphoribosylaminoimidazole carboxylase (NCAIR synthetase)